MRLRVSAPRPYRLPSPFLVISPIHSGGGLRGAGPIAHFLHGTAHTVTHSPSTHVSRHPYTNGSSRRGHRSGGVYPRSGRSLGDALFSRQDQRCAGGAARAEQGGDGGCGSRGAVPDMSRSSFHGVRRGSATAAAKEKSDVDEEGKEEDNEEVLVGVTKLEGCGHVFCRRDLTEWIRSQHGSCPTCRHTFLNIRPLSAVSDDESSDGGEYVPNPEDFEDEDEEHSLTSTGMDVDFGDIWGEHGDDLALGVELECDVEGDSIMGDSEMGDVDEDEYDEEENDASFEWGLTDGESESMTSSEAGDSTLGSEAAGVAAANVPHREVSVSVHEAEDANAKEGEGINVDVNASTLDVRQQDKEISSS
ncbi:hypothetical protein BJ912DRAFT_1057906 [Pholiota molesta]|nr:hypothetical protein BJ912DRAFT_1057906 [Pholiota molesta]